MLDGCMFYKMLVFPSLLETGFLCFLTMLVPPLLSLDHCHHFSVLLNIICYSNISI